MTALCAIIYFGGVIMAKTLTANKNNQVKITLTDDVYALLQQTAGEQGLTMTAWCAFVVGERLATIRRQNENNKRMLSDMVDKTVTGVIGTLEPYLRQEIEKENAQYDIVLDERLEEEKQKFLELNKE